MLKRRTNSFLAAFVVFTILTSLWPTDNRVPTLGLLTANAAGASDEIVFIDRSWSKGTSAGGNFAGTAWVAGTNAAGTAGGGVANPYNDNKPAMLLHNTGPRLDRTTPNLDAPYGYAICEFDMWPSTTSVSTRFQVRTNTGSDIATGFGARIIDFDETGNLRVGGEGDGSRVSIFAGKYTAGVKYSFKVYLDSLNNRYKAYIISGELNGAAVQSPTPLGPYDWYSLSPTDERVTMGYFYFVGDATQLDAYGTTDGRYMYVDNIKMTVPNAITSCSAIDSNGMVTESTLSYPLYMSRMFQTTAAGQTAAMPGFVIRKTVGGSTVDVPAGDYTILNGYTHANTTWGGVGVGGRTTITFNSNLEPGAQYTFDLTGVKDAYGQFYQEEHNITFTVDNPARDATLSGLAAPFDTLVFGDGEIKGFTKGQDAFPLLEAATVKVSGATKKLIDAHGREQALSAVEQIYLFGGEKIRVTSSDGSTTKDYTLVPQDDLIKDGLTFNSAVTDYEDRAYFGMEGSTGQAMDRFILGESTKLTHLTIPTSDPDQVYIYGNKFGAKEDLSAAMVYNEHTGGANSSWNTLPGIASTGDKVYGINFSILLSGPGNGKFDVALRNGSATLYGSLAVYEPSATIVSMCVPSGNPAAAQAIAPLQKDVWYNFGYIIDRPSKKIKSYLNGEYIGENTGSFFDPVPEPTANATQIRFTLFGPGSTDNRYTNSMYVDNVFVYELPNYNMPANFYPSRSDFKFSPEPSGVLQNAVYEVNTTSSALALGADLKALTFDTFKETLNLPSGYTALLYDPTEQTPLSNFDWETYTTHKLVLKNGDFVKNYNVSLKDGAILDDYIVGRPEFFAGVSPISGVNDGDVLANLTAEVSFLNNQSAPQNIVGVMTYLEEGQIKKFSSVSKTTVPRYLDPGYNTAKLTMTINEPMTFDYDKASDIKIYIWDDFGSMYPLTLPKTIKRVDTSADINAMKANLQQGIFNTTVDPTAELAALQGGGRFDGLTYDTSDPRALAIEVFDNRLQKMIKAYTSVGNSKYGDPDLKIGIDAVLKDWADNDYGAATVNWWDKEIGIPKILGNIFIYEYPIEDQDVKAKLKDIAKRSLVNVDWSIPHGARKLNDDYPESNDPTGANLTDKLNVMLKVGITTDDVDIINTVKLLLENELKTFENGQEGIMADNSFQQHNKYLYSGSYGEEFTKTVNEMLTALKGTSFMVSTRALNAYADFFLEGQQYILRNKIVDFSTTGRALAREGFINDSLSKNVANSVDLLLGMGNVSSDRVARLGTLKTRLKAGSDNTTTAAKHFWTSDFTVVHRPDYYLSVRGSSIDTVKTEFIEENKKGYFLADGTTVIMKDGSEYKNIFPAWDWNKLPGTTTVQMATIPQLVYQEDGDGTFAGGVSDGVLAVAAYGFKNDRETAYLDANKAYFMFTEGFTALGNGITSTVAGRDVVTSLEQTLSKGDVVYSNGSNQTLAVGGVDVAASNIKWALHNGIGYIINSDGANITIANSEKTGAWNSIGKNNVTGSVTTNIFGLYLNHGQATGSTPADYSYTVLPNTNATDIATYVGNPNLVEINNGGSTSAVWSKNDDALGIVFWSAGTVAATSAKTGLASNLTVQADKPCIVLIRKISGTWYISASNPNNRSNKDAVPVAITLTGEITATINLNITGATVTQEIPQS